MKIPAKFVKATVFQAASQERLKDAQCLHGAGRYDGAIYLCGYAIECRLKWCNCSARRISRLDEAVAKRLGHKLGELLTAAGLNQRLAEKRDLDIAFQRIARIWSTEIRYSGNAAGRKESESFLRDSEWLLRWLGMVSKL